MIKKETIFLYTPIVLVCINLLLKMLFVSSTSIGGDEPFSIYHAQMDVQSIVHQLTQGNNPPLYEILLHYWIRLFGISELSVRMPSVILSSLTVLFVYKTGKDFFSYQTGLVAATIYTLSNFSLSLAHEARVYALFAFLTAMSMYYFCLLIKSPKVTRYLFFLLLANVLAIYSHYFGFFIIIIQSLAIIAISDVRKALWKTYGWHLIILAVLYLPIAGVFWHRFRVSSVSGWLTPPTGIASLYNMLRCFSNQPLTTVACLAVFVAALVKYFITARTPAPVYAKIMLLWFLFPFLFMFGISFWIPMYFDRYLLFVSIGYYLSVSIVASSLVENKIYSYAISGLLVLLFAVTFNPDMENKRHVKETVAKIRELQNDSTVVLICPADFALNFSYYYDQAIFTDVDCATVYGKILHNLHAKNVYPINAAGDYPFAAKRIIYLDAAGDFVNPGNNILNTLKSKYNLRNSYKFYKIFQVYEFEAVP
jgi:mannosyltransferase